jgi:hypothetical protein
MPTIEANAARTSAQSRTPYIAVIIVAVIVVMLLGLSVIGLDVSDPLGSLLLLGFALALALAGVLVWWPDREATGSRSNLGAALLGGAVITFTVFGFQLGDARRQAAIDHRYQAVLIRVQDTGNKIQTQGNQIQVQAISLQKQLARAASARQLETLQRGQQPFQLVIALQQDLTGIDLHGKDLSGYYLRNKVLVRANLSQADLREANLEGTNLTNADLRGANLQGAIASRSTQWPEGFDPQEAGVKLR